MLNKIKQEKIYKAYKTIIIYRMYKRKIIIKNKKSEGMRGNITDKLKTSLLKSTFQYAN